MLHSDMERLLLLTDRVDEKKRNTLLVAYEELEAAGQDLKNKQAAKKLSTAYKEVESAQRKYNEEEFKKRKDPSVDIREAADLLAGKEKKLSDILRSLKEETLLVEQKKLNLYIIGKKVGLLQAKIGSFAAELNKPLAGFLENKKANQSDLNDLKVLARKTSAINQSALVELPSYLQNILLTLIAETEPYKSYSFDEKLMILKANYMSGMLEFKPLSPVELLNASVNPELRKFIEELDKVSVRELDMASPAFLDKPNLSANKVAIIDTLFITFYKAMQNSLQEKNTFKNALDENRENFEALVKEIRSINVAVLEKNNHMYQSDEIGWKRMFESYKKQQEYRAMLPNLVLRVIENILPPVVIEKKRGNTVDAVKALSNFLNTLEFSDANNVQKQNQMTEYLKNLGINLQGDKIKELFKRFCSQMKDVSTYAEGKIRKPDEGKVLLYLAKWPKLIQERKLELDQMKLYIDMHLSKYVSNTLLNNAFKALEEPSQFEKALEHARNPQNAWPPAGVLANPFSELIVYLCVLKDKKVGEESVELLERIKVCINKLGFDLKNDEIDNILQQVPRLSPANPTPETKLETKKDDNISQQVSSGSPGSLTSRTEGAGLLSRGGFFSGHSLSSEHDTHMRPQSPSNASLSQESSDNSHTRPVSPFDMSRSDSESVSVSSQNEEAIDTHSDDNDELDKPVLPENKQKSGKDLTSDSESEVSSEKSSGGPH